MRLIFTTAGILVCLFSEQAVLMAQLPNSWLAAGSDNLWSNPDNWIYGVVPGNATSHPNFGWDDPSGPRYPLTPDPEDDLPLGNNNAFLDALNSTTLIDSTVNATAYGVRVGGNRGAPATLMITGGMLQIGGTPPNQPNEIVGWHLDIGRGFNATGDPNSTQRVIMTGGTVVTNLIKVPEQFVDNTLQDPTDSAPLNGELIMSGGTINGRAMNLGQLKGNGMAQLSGDAEINLASNVPGNPGNGGHLEFNRDWFVDGLPVSSSGNVNFDLRNDAIINIFGHIDQFTSFPDQGEVNRYEGYVDDHWLTAWGGTAAPVITLVTDNGDPMITIEAPTVPGDYNNNGVVDSADYAVWLSHQGAAVALNGEDPNAETPGLVDQEDYDFWKSNVGVTAADIAPLPPLPGVAAGETGVPEPSAGSLCLVALGYLGIHLRSSSCR